MSSRILNPLISVKEARKLLGSDSNNLTDDDIMGIIMKLQQLAGDILDTIKVPNSDEGKNG